MPAGCIFSVGGPAGFPAKPYDLWAVIAVLNSDLILFCGESRRIEHNWEVSNIASMPMSPVACKSNTLSSLSRECHDLLLEWDTGNETSTVFIKPWLLQVLHGFNQNEKPITEHPFAKQFSWSNWASLKDIRAIKGTARMSLRELSSLAINREETMRKRIDELQRLINEEVYRIYEIGEEDRRLIEKELALRRGEFFSSIQKEVKEDSSKVETQKLRENEVKVKDHVVRLISFYIKKTLEADTDGIVPLHQLVEEVRNCLAKDFGKDQVEIKEKEIEEILGKNLEEWIATEYFDFHVNLYKRRPIFWHLTSANFSKTRGSKGTFNIFVHYHKLDRDTIPKIRINYLKPEIEIAKRKVERLKKQLQEIKKEGNKKKERKISKELERALATLEELQAFDKALETVHNPRPDKTKLPKKPRWVDLKIAEVRDNGYNPNIDYGVRVNIEPLKEANLLHKAARRVK